MTTLYRKYRPQSFSDLTGQEHIVQTIMNEIALAKVAHAYLFSGPRGVGKTTLARLLAKAVNCPNRKDGKSEPCGTCASCQEIATGRNIDVIEIDAASHTGVDNVRENIIENAQFKPTKSPYKVFIIDEVHMLSNSAFNALLKTLEEPPAHVIFVLATTELHKLPATVISRCQRFNFKKIPYEIMLQRLKKLVETEGVKVDKEILERIVAKSDGCLRDAESLLGQVLTIDKKHLTVKDTEMMLPSPTHEIVMEFLKKIHEANSSSALALLDTLSEQGISPDQFIGDLIELLRALMILQAGAGQNLDSEFNNEIFKQIKKLAAELPAASVLKFIDRALARRLETKTAPLPFLPLELLAVEGCWLWQKQGAETEPNNYPTINLTENPPVSKTPPVGQHRLSSTIKNAIAHLTHDSTPLKTTLEELVSKWKEVIAVISTDNPSLTFILSMCTLAEIENRTLKIEVPYAIHKDKLNEPKNRQLIEASLEKIFGEPIRCACAVASQKPSSAANIDIQNLAVEFGGELVNS